MILESALQKMVRRIKLKEGLYYTADLDLLGRGNSTFTNLLLFVSEDISLADPSISYFLICLYELLKKYLKSNKIKSSESYLHDSARFILLTASYITITAKKSRIINNASVFSHALDYKTSENLDILLKFLDKAIKEKR